MKRFKAFFLATVLTATFAGNIFATGGLATLPTSLIAYAISAVSSLVGSDDQCPLRQCTQCRPNTEGDGGGDCRPTPN
jgi:hypothetical protein